MVALRPAGQVAILNKIQANAENIVYGGVMGTQKQQPHLLGKHIDIITRCDRKQVRLT